MASDKKGFILYADQKALFEQLPDDKAGELIKHIFKYVNDEDPETEDLLINLAFTPIKQQFKRDLEKWENTREGRSKAGKASAEARRIKKEQEPTKSTNVKSVEQEATNPTVKENVTVNVNETVSVIKTTPEQFLKVFNETRISKGLKSNIKKLGYDELANFKLLEDYDVEEFKYAINNCLDDKWVKDNKQGFPSHLLKYFTKYLNAESKKELTIGEKLAGKC
jgi:hypothetical protein